jgi:aspartate/methionine/tyrosine aminotransferase
MSRPLPQGSLISYMSTMVKERGGVNLAQGLPGFEPPVELLDYLSEIAHNPIHQYPPGIGNFKILDLLVQQYGLKIPVTRDNFLITQGATEAISLLYLYLMRKIGEPFSVMAFGPAYESYTQLPKYLGQQFVEAQLLADGGFDADIVEKQIKDNNVKIFFAASPSNPYGRIMPRSYVEQLTDICSRNSCYLIFDAVYKELYYENPPYIPLEHIGEYVFYVNSFSKLLSITGWRVGYMITAPHHMQAIRRLHDYTGLCVNSVCQEAIARYLENYNMGLDYVAGLRSMFFQSFKKMVQVLERLGFEIPPTDGGYFIWSKLPQGFDDGFEVAVDLYEQTRVATVPGIHFSPSGKNYIRFNIARPDEDIEKGIVAVNTFFGRGS